MKTHHFILIPLLLLWTSREASGDCSAVAKQDVIDTQGPFDIIANEYIAYICITTKIFSTGDTVLTSKCVDGVWTTIAATCTDGSVTACAVDPSIVPTDLVEEIVVTSNILAEVLKAYKCIAEKSWLTGEDVRITHCKDGSWTEILDICDASCPVPRHCSDVAALGLTDSGSYYVVPSGENNGYPYQVPCSLDDSNPAENGGNWTNIFSIDIANSFDTQTQLEYTKGFTIDANNYFVGIDYLAEVSKEVLGTTQTQILEVLFKDVSGNRVAYATYGNFSVGQAADNYVLSSLGSYHGDAGDGFCSHLYTEFDVTSAPASIWWGVSNSNQDLLTTYNGSYLTALGQWNPAKTHLNFATVTTVVMRIRPATQDAVKYCPPMVGSESYWTGTNASIPYTRMPGVVISWECLEDLLQEGEDPGTRTHAGNVTCLDTSPPQWSNNVILPCTMTCPTGFEMSDDARICLHYSTTTASMYKASVLCEAMGANLALLNVSTDMAKAEASTSYIVGSNTIGGQATLNSPMPTHFNTCDNFSKICSPTTSNKCTAVEDGNEYFHEPCLSELNYVCEMPTVCPTNFNDGYGPCLSLSSATYGSVLEALEYCQPLGAVLPNFDSTIMLDNFAEWVCEETAAAVIPIALPIKVAIGMNEANGYMPADSDYNLLNDPTLMALSHVNDMKKHRYILIDPDCHWTIETCDLSENVGSMHAVCRYYGPQDCDLAAPDITQNMSRSWGWSQDENAVSTYTCFPGYFFYSNNTINVLESTCYAQFEGWVPKVIPDCIVLEVCDINQLIVSGPSTNNTDLPYSQYLNSTITYSCPTNMTTTSGTETNTTCTIDGSGVYNYNLITIPVCDTCTENVTVENSGNDYVLNALKVVGQFLAITCTGGYVYNLTETVQNLECTDLGFNKDGIVPCYKACISNPPLPASADAGVTVQAVTNNRNGTQLFYNCTTEGEFFSLSAAHPDLHRVLMVTCNEETWTKERALQELTCSQLCAQIPPSNPANANTTWDGFSRSLDTTITYYAEQGYLFGTFEESWAIVCNGTHWLPADLSSSVATGVGDEFKVRQACLGSPPASIGGAATVGFASNAYGFVQQVLIYECASGFANFDGKTDTSITCNSSALWTGGDPTFLCQPSCDGPPPVPIEKATYNFTDDIREGTIVSYHCDGGFGPGLGLELEIECLNGNWSWSDVAPIHCYTVTQPPDTTLPPYVLTTLPVESEQYTFTSTKNYGQLESEMTTITSGPQVTILNAPFGHGTGITTESKYSQCMEKQNFVPAHLKCLINPKYCTNGLSFSIWVKNIFHSDSQKNLTDLTEADNRYFVSTGGSTNGQAGIALYSNKAWIIAIVSTAEEYWITKVLGPIPNNTWSNLGVRFNKNDFGLELFVNSSKVGGTMNSISVNPTLGIIPPTLVIGCLKNSAGSPLYQYFSDSSFDEFAIWDPCLEMENINYFMGGHKENMSDIVAEQFELILNSVDLADPDQQAAAKQIVQSLLGSEIVEPSQASPSDVPVSGNDSSVVSTMNPNDINIAKSFLVKAKIMVKLLNDKKVATTIPVDRAKRMLEIKSTVSDMLVKGNTDKWKNVQKLTEDVGGMQMVNTLIKYEQAILRSIPWPIGTDPECLENIEKSLYSKSCKMTIRQFQAMGNKIQEPTYTQPRMIQMRKNWDGFITDYIKFPTNIFTDPRCFERPLTYTAFVFDAVSKYATTKGHPVQFNTNTPKAIDSRITSVKLTPDLAKNEFGERLTEEPLCEPDVEAMMYSTLVIRAEHQTKSPANYIEKRKLLLFEDVSESTVEERFCVWWNENVSDIGVWDKSGCSILETNSQYTTCACQHFGIFAVLAVLSEPIEVPEEPSWLTTVRFILYIVSIVAVLIYIVVVIISGDLKDQFHLIGVNLSVAILSGSILMLISDSDSIRDDRGSCAIVGAMIQLFYGAVGTWMLGLAHSSFRGITAGVIGGHLKGYMLLCWGAPIAFTGLPFLIFEPKNLGDDPRCFVAWDTMVKSIFFAPQTLYAVLGLFFALVVVFNLSTPALRKDNLIEDYGSFCRGASLLVMLLSVTWMLGFFAYLPILDEPDFYPIFQVLNSIAGICLLIFIGFGSARFRSFLLGTAKAKREQLRRHAFGLPAASEFDNKDYDLSTNLVPPEIPPS